MSTQIITNISQIFLNIVGGAIVVGLLELGKCIFRHVKRLQFKRFFGEDILKSDIHIVYAELGLSKIFDKTGNLVTHPYIKPGEESIGANFSVERPISSCEIRATKYLTEVISKKSNQSPQLSSDDELKGRLDISFISLGGPFSNFKTRDAMDNDGNNLIYFDNRSFFSKKSKTSVLTIQSNFDYGIILKIHPSQFTKRTWFVCAGLGEWGTSGAAWYLSYKWKKIYRYAKQNAFAVIIKVNRGQDESAEPVVKVLSEIDVERYTMQANSNQK